MPAGGLHAAAVPPFTVAQDGSGHYRTMHEALDAASATGAVLHVEPGTCREKPRIEKHGISYTATADVRKILCWSEDVVLVWGDSAAMTGGTGKSGCLSVSGDDFVATNLTIQSDWKVKGPLLRPSSFSLTAN